MWFKLIPHETYVVFGLQILGGMPWVELLSDSGYLFSVPLCLFDIIDGTVSQYWEARITKELNLLMWPPSFYKEFYHDDLLEGRIDAVHDFQKVLKRIESERQI